MYHLLGAQENIENIVALCGNYLKNHSMVTEKDLKTAYHQWLNTTQPDYMHYQPEELITDDKQIEKHFTNYFTEEKRVNDVVLSDYISTHPDAKERKAALELGLQDIKHYDNTLYTLIHFVMHTILCTSHNKKGGTSVNPSYIGMMCAYHDMHAEQDTIPELIIHEFSHNLLFIDEHRYGHYTDYHLLALNDLKIESYYQDQLIHLPLDRVLHRMVIFVELLCLRDKMIGHDKKVTQHLPSQQLIDIMHWYIEQIENKEKIKSLMSERMNFLYETMKKFINKYQLSE